MKTTNPSTNVKKFTRKLIDAIEHQNDLQLCKIASEEDGEVECHFLMHIEGLLPTPAIHSRYIPYDEHEDLGDE